MGRLSRYVAIALLALVPASLAEERAAGAARVAGGVEQLLAEVRTQRMVWERRQRELEERERSVAELEEQVEKRIQELEEIQTVIEERIAGFKSEQGDQIARLAKVYSSMKPDSAAPLLEDLDVTLASQVLRKMKHKQSAAVLSLLSKERALLMSRVMARPLTTDPEKGGGR